MSACIGKTFEVQADLRKAFETFVALIEDEETKAFYKSKKVEIETIFRQSDTDNLRILQQTMWDFERIVDAMLPAHRKSTEALTAVSAPYFALSFELKAHRLIPEDVRGFGGPDFARYLRKGGPTSRREEIEKRYPEIRFEDSIIGMKVIGDALFKSTVDPYAINDLMSKSRFFASAADEPAWRSLWFSSERTVEEAQLALDAVERQFRERQFSKQGVLLHVFGLRLWTSRIDAIPLNKEDVVRECKVYVDDLYTMGRLDPSTAVRDLLGTMGDSYEGLGFMERETPQFQELARYLSDFELKAIEDTYPRKAEELLAEMGQDTALFIRRLCLTNSAENLYASVPILTYVTAEEFVDHLMNLSPDVRRTALMAFAQRYNFLQATPKLVPELSWLAQVESILRNKATLLPPIARYALIGAVERYIHIPLQSALQKVSSASQTISESQGY